MRINPTVQYLLPRLGRGLKILALAGGAAVAAAGVATVILWDADHFAARDKYELFKVAWFGPWRDQRIHSLRGATNINFFVTATAPGTNLRFHTGVSFKSVGDLVTGQVGESWCYIVNVERNSAFGNRISLGIRSGDNAPVFVNATAITADQAAVFNTTPGELVTAAREHCALSRDWSLETASSDR